MSASGGRVALTLLLFETSVLVWVAWRRQRTATTAERPIRGTAHAEEPDFERAEFDLPVGLGLE